MSNEQSWKDGVRAEVGFWRRWATQSSDAFKADFEWRMNPASALQPLITDLLDPALDEVRILDVGAGPVSVVGKVWGDRVVRIDAADALAEQYNEALQDAGVVPLVRTQQCFSEALTEKFGRNIYDAVFARNTLDHSLDPALAFREMIYVAKPGGVVITQHAENEAEKQDYKGLHGWNFTKREDRLVVWNATTAIDVAESISDLADPVKVWSAKRGVHNLVFGVYRKRK